jgi:cyanophycinase
VGKHGHLVIIGGAEDRQGPKEILSRVAEVSEGEKGHVVLLTTASEVAAKDAKAEKEFREIYEPAFKECGMGRVTPLSVFTRQAANDPANIEAIEKSTCVFMSGGSQERLTSILAGTEMCAALHRGFRTRGLTIAGTSAGASVMSEHMLLGGSSDSLPRKRAVPVAAGLGFLYQAIIDQHFTERQRIGRLLSVIAQNPFLIGIGIDEDTALIVHPGVSMEVVGNGAVTLVDGRSMIYSNINEVREGDVLAMSNIQLHLLPAGFKHNIRYGKERNAFDEVLETAMAVVRNERFDNAPPAPGHAATSRPGGNGKKAAS